MISALSAPATVDLSALLTPLGQIVSVREATLGANMFTDETSEMRWNQDQTKRDIPSMAQGDFEFTLMPTQIKTYVVEMEK